MSLVKINNAEYDDISLNVKKAAEELEQAENIWGENFDNLYYNIVTSGWLDSLYDDAASNYHIWKGTIKVIAGAAPLALLAAGLVVAGPVGWIAAALIAIFGAISGFKTIAQDPIWITVSKQVFIDLLYNCMCGYDDNYVRITNLMTKFYNVQISLEKIKTLVNEYQQLYADLEAAAKTQGLENKLDLAGDSTTVLGINTDVEVDGKVVTLHASDAMNALFTYTNTVMDSEIAADYLERTYGYKINYEDIVKNANSFMYNTINSGLYSHEFIDKILPENYPNAASTYGQNAYNAVTGATGVDLEHIQSALNNTVAGSVALFGGLLGTAFIGNVAKPNNGGSSGGSGGSGGHGGGGYGGGSSGGGSVPVVPPVVPDPVDPVDPVDPEPEQKNDIEIEPVIEDIELPEEIEFEINPDGEPDYDELARDSYEFEQDYEELIKHRTEIIEDIEAKWEAGDLDSIREELKEYGYNSAEIEAIIQDKHLTIKAILEGDQNAIIAQKARELAKEAGIEDYVSKYEGRPNYDDLIGEGPSEALILSSGDETVVKAKEAMDEARDSYEKSVIAASALLTTVKDNEKVMTDLQTKYVAEYGTDTKMWPEDAAKEYNESIKTYNESVKKADESLKEVEEEKKKYSEAKKGFVDAKKEFFEKSKEEYEKIAMTPVDEEGNPSVIEEQPSAPAQGDDMGVSINEEEGTISFNPTMDNGIPDKNAMPVGDEDGALPTDTIGVTYLD